MSSFWGNGVLFSGLAASSSVSILLYAQLKEILPSHVLGLASTSLNFFVMIGGAMLMQFIGRIVQHYSLSDTVQTVEGYSAAFWFCLLISFASLLFYVFSKEATLVSENSEV